MKKISKKQLRFQRRKNLRVMRLRQRRNYRHRPNRRVAQSRISSGVHLVAPSHFVLMSGRSFQHGADVNRYFEFLHSLRESKAGELLIDMSSVRRMVVDAALLFKAELSRLVQVGAIRIKAIPPKSTRIQQVLKQTKLDQILNLKIDVTPDRDDVVRWRIAEGPRNKVDSSVLAPIMDDIEEVTGLASHPMYQGIIESIGNCVEHAYKDHPEVTRFMPTNPGWWVFQQVKNDHLIVVVCDLGIGVSRALPLTLADQAGVMQKLMHLVRKAKGSDNRALLAAMEYGRTSTKEPQRGKGMRNAHAVIDESGAGDFYAVSNRGFYVYQRAPDAATGNSRTIKLRHSINGTIMGWRLPLTAPKSESLS